MSTGKEGTFKIIFRMVIMMITKKENAMFDIRYRPIVAVVSRSITAATTSSKPEIKINCNNNIMTQKTAATT